LHREEEEAQGFHLVSMTRLCVRQGTYTEAPGAITIPAGGALIGEAFGSVRIILGGAGTGSQLNTIPATIRETFAGTYTATQGSATIVGVGSVFTTVIAGDMIQVGDAWLEIASVTDDLNLTLLAPYEGVTITGASVFAQAMAKGVEYENLIIQGGDNSGLSFYAVLGGVVRDCIFDRNSLGAFGVAFELLQSVECSIEDVGIQFANHRGLRLSSCWLCNSHSVVAKNCVEDGIQVSFSFVCSFISCSSIANGQVGFGIQSGSSGINIGNCVASNNDLQGFRNFIGTSQVQITSCEVRRNGAEGIRFDGDDNVVEGCDVIDNGAEGILAGDGGRILGNVVAENGTLGINAQNDDSVAMSDNIVRDNTSDGIRLGADSTCVGCVVTGNGGIGIQLWGDSAVVSANRVTGNTGDGIEVRNAGVTNCIVAGNQTQGNAVSIDDNGTGTIVANNQV
jgi:hypothetical protein